MEFHSPIWRIWLRSRCFSPNNFSDQLPRIRTLHFSGPRYRVCSTISLWSEIVAGEKIETHELGSVWAFGHPLLVPLSFASIRGDQTESVWLGRFKAVTLERRRSWWTSFSFFLLGLHWWLPQIHFLWLCAISRLGRVQILSFLVQLFGVGHVLDCLYLYSVQDL